MLKRSQQIAKEVGRPESAPTSLPMPGVLQVRDAMMDEVIGATMMETLAILAMEPGDKQTAALKELLARYPPPTADTANDLSREEAATKIQSVFRGHKARRETKQIANMRGRGADLREKVREDSAISTAIPSGLGASPPANSRSSSRPDECTGGG